MTFIAIRGCVRGLGDGWGGGPADGGVAFHGAYAITRVSLLDAVDLIEGRMDAEV